MNDELEAKVAVAGSRLDRLERDIDEIKREQKSGNADIRAMRDAMMQVKGGWKTAIAIGGAGGAAGALLAKVLPFWFAAR